LGEKTDLRVEGKSRGALQVEKGMSGLAPEPLETALGIADVLERKQPRDAVENLPHELAQPILMNLNPRIPEAARAQHHIASVEKPVQEFLDLPDRCGKVGVRKHDVLAPGLKHSPLHARAFATIPLVSQNLRHAAEASPFLPRHFRRAVRAPVVDHDDFVIPRLRLEEFANLPERAPQTLALVVAGDDDGKLHGAKPSDAAGFATMYLFMKGSPIKPGRK
jgi:hypothetical protein